LDFAADDHKGWIADADVVGFLARTLRETGDLGILTWTCETLPVWCCWK
jgi:hypothetical protein